MPSQQVFTDKAPKPIGPYSQAIRCGDLLFISGQIPLDPVTGAMVGTTVAEQARQALSNLKAILTSQGLTPHSLVKTTVFLRDMAAFAEFNAVYQEELAGAAPARSVVAVVGLPKDVKIEIEGIACR